MQFRFIASGWLVHELTDSAFWLGVPGIISAIVTLLLTLPAGALADRVDNQRLLTFARALTGIAHFALGLLTVTEVVEVWMVLVWAGVVGALGALSSPAQNAMLPRLIERSAMASAVALNGAIWSGMRIIGPALAGIVIAVVGIGQAFFVTAAGFAVSTYLVSTLRLVPLERTGETADFGMFAGLRYIVQNRIFLATIGLSLLTSIFGSSYVVLLPIFADDILHAGVRGFGYMEAFSAVYLNLGMTTLQLLVPGELRGRVMAVWGLTWFLSSVGGFVAATIADFLGAPFAVALGALSVSGFALIVYVAFEEVRNIPAN